MTKSPYSLPRLMRTGLLAVLLGSSALVGVGTAATPAPINPPLAAGPNLSNVPDFADLVARVKPAVVSVTTKMAVKPASDDGTPMQPGRRPGRTSESRGSGFIVSADGIVVTNNHVVANAQSVTVTLDDGRELTAKVLGRDQRSDIALLKIDAKADLPYLMLAETVSARPGEWVLALGNPFGLGGSVTAGIVSARGRNIGAGPYDDFIQVDAPINHGNSGGPLFNQAGQVIGVNTAILSPSGGSVGIGFAIPSDMVKKVVAELQSTGHVTRGYLGVETQQIDRALAAALRLGNPEGAGALVATVAPDSPAAKAGLQAGDVLGAVDGQKLADPRALARAVAAFKPGSDAKFDVQRDGETKTITVALGAMPNERLADTGAADKQDGIGVNLAPITPQLRAQLDLPASAKGAIIAG
ncbi:MAG: trypsin-like peptidase domain-containing protein, partial [Acetobacteraceae bacterium]|nr:trypsin-like peptidase domain-containing protein [Acetobacteraceae bacterium]